MNKIGFPLLTSIVLLPVVGAIVVSLLPKSRSDVIKATGTVFMTATAGLIVFMLLKFEKVAGYQFVSQHVWIKDFGVSWKLGVDGISLFMVVLSGLLFPLVLVGVRIQYDVKSMVAWLLVLQAGCLGSFLSLDLFLFFAFFESVLIPMYFIIGGWGHEGRVYASMKFFLYTLVGSVLMLVGMLALVFLSAKGSEPITFDIVVLATRSGVLGNAGEWIFLSFALAFAIKVPLFPLHTWLPDAHTEAPTAGSVILAGVMLKLGTYGLLRFGLSLFPGPAQKFAPIFLTLSVIGIIYGAIVATVQKDLKRLVAYSSVAHLGFIVMGTFAFTTQGISGGVLQNLNHGISTGALFLLVGMIYERRHTREISKLKGIQHVAPIFAGVFTVVMLSSIGVPGLNGFIGEYLILMGTFVTRRWWAVVAASGVILSALYLLWAYQRSFHGPTDDANKDFKEMNNSERLVMAPLLALIVFLGVYPKPVLDRINPSVESVVSKIQAQGATTDPRWTPHAPSCPGAA